MRKHIENFTIILLAVLIIIMSLVYAKSVIKYENNDFKLKKDFMSLKITNLRDSEMNSLMNILGPNIIENQTFLSFAIDFTKKDYYEFYFDIENHGDVDAILNSIILSAKNDIDEKSESVTNSNSLLYSDNLLLDIKYIDDVFLNVNDQINSKSKKSFKVTIKYFKKTVDESDKFSFNINLNYVKK